MSNVFFTSDWHLGHRNILKYRAGFDNIQEHDATLIKNFNSVVTKRDKTFFLGDMLFDRQSLGYIKCLNGSKVLILGNHDYSDIKELMYVFDAIMGPIKYNSRFWLTHHPMHPQELYGKLNIHGHTHNQSVMLPDGSLDPRYFNVCPDVNNNMPVPFDVIQDARNKAFA